MKTKPAWPKLTWIEQGPEAPTVGKKFDVLKEGWIVSSSFLPLRVKKMVPVRGRYPTPMTSPSWYIGNGGCRRT